MKSSAFVLASILCALFAFGKSDALERPNVLLLIIDDASPLYHSVYQEGPVSTPNFERLAQSSVWFSRGYTQPGCCVSRTSFLTSTRPSTTGVYYNGQSYRQAKNWVGRMQNLPQRFLEEGYTTAGFGKIFHNRYQEEDADSFTPGYFVPYSNKLESELNQHALPGSIVEIPDGPDNYTWGVLPDDWDRNDPDKMQQDTVNAHRAVDFLNQSHEKPFFLAYGCWRPHVRWTVPQRYYDAFPLDEIELPAGALSDDLEDLPTPARWVATHRGFHDKIVKAGLWKKAIQALYAATTYADEQIGKVIDALDASPYRDNTIVIFIADNGWHTGQKNHWSKFALWNLASHVPFAFRVPSEDPHIIDTPVSSLDIYPSLLTLCGIDAPQTHSLEGVDLTPMLRGETKERGRPVILTHGWENHAVQSDRFRYIRYKDGSEELYDHFNDPHEWRNLAALDRYEPIKIALAQHLPFTNAKPIPMAGEDMNVLTQEAFTP